MNYIDNLNLTISDVKLKHLSRWYRTEKPYLHRTLDSQILGPLKINVTLFLHIQNIVLIGHINYFKVFYFFLIIGPLFFSLFYYFIYFWTSLYYLLHIGEKLVCNINKFFSL